MSILTASEEPVAPIIGEEAMEEAKARLEGTIELDQLGLGPQGMIRHFEAMEARAGRQNLATLLQILQDCGADHVEIAFECDMDRTTFCQTGLRKGGASVDLPETPAGLAAIWVETEGDTHTVFVEVWSGDIRDVASGVSFHLARTSYPDHVGQDYNLRRESPVLQCGDESDRRSRDLHCGVLTTPCEKG